MKTSTNKKTVKTRKKVAFLNHLYKIPGMESSNPTQGNFVSRCSLHNHVLVSTSLQVLGDCSPHISGRSHPMIRTPPCARERVNSLRPCFGRCGRHEPAKPRCELAEFNGRLRKCWKWPGERSGSTLIYPTSVAVNRLGGAMAALVGWMMILSANGMRATVP